MPVRLGCSDLTKFSCLAVLFLLGATAGCSRGHKTYPVEGQVVWKGGVEARELAGGVITLDSLPLMISATGQIGADGSFRLGTYGLNDGVPAGEFKVAVTRPPESEINGTWVPLPRKFESVESSGLTLQIEPKRNIVKVEIEQAKRK